MSFKHFFTLAMMSVALVASAINPIKNFTDGYWLNVLPKPLSYDGKQVFYIGRSEDATIINENLDTVEKIPYIMTSITKTTVFIGPKLIEYNEYNSNSQTVNTQIEATTLIKALYSNKYVSYSTTAYGGEGTDTWYFEGTSPVPSALKNILDHMGEYNMTDVYGYIGTYTDYRGFACYNDLRHDLSTYEPTGATYSDGSLTDEVFEYEPETETEQVRPQLFDFDDFSGAEFGEYYISQTLFNSDADFEMLVPVFGNTVTRTNDDNMIVEYTDQWGNSNSVWISGQKKTTAPALSALKAVEAKTGRTLCTFNIPAECKRSECYARVYFIGSKRYLSVEVWNGGEEDEYMWFYDLDEDSSIKSPVMEQHVKVSPQVVSRGQQINVSTDGEELRSVSVTSANGISELNRRASGKSAAIETSALSPGAHIVGASTASGRTSYSKVIVR